MLNIIPTVSYVCIINIMHVVHICIGNNCLPLSNPDNGQVYQLPDGTAALFSCDNGFTKMGESVLRCDNGNWSSSPPTCVQS